MLPRCVRNGNKKCKIHKDGKYLKWSCGEEYDPIARKNRYQKTKKPCVLCGNITSKSKCVRCVAIENGKKRVGKKLPKEWCENISKGQQQEKSSSWKGDKVGYSALHKWLRKYYGNPTKCEWCGIKGFKNGRAWSLDWANKTGRYLRDISDWVGLCRKCHSKQTTILKRKGIKNRIHWNS